METDELSDPIQVGFLGFTGQPTLSNYRANLSQERTLFPVQGYRDIVHDMLLRIPMLLTAIRLGSESGRFKSTQFNGIVPYISRTAILATEKPLNLQSDRDMFSFGHNK